MTPRVHLAATNLRELGGYATSCGRTIKPGLLFRCGQMANLDNEGTELYRNLGLSTIVDLRRPDEIAQHPTPTFGRETNLNYSVSRADNSFAVAAGQVEDPGAAEKMIGYALDFYREIVEVRLDHYVPVFDAIFDPDALPALFHCTAGKDRTGFVAAATLKFLGVDDATIMADYMATNWVRAPFVESRLEFLANKTAAEQGTDPANISDAALQALSQLLHCDESMLTATYEAVETTYGTWDRVRVDGLGIDDARLERFKDAVLA